MQPLLFGRPSEPDDEHDWSGVSVVMIQNLPCRCTPEEIAAAVEELGFGAYVNYFHLPRKASGGRNCGYGFIGFISPEHTEKFRNVFEGYTLKSRASAKQLTLKPAHQQQAVVNKLQSKSKAKEGDRIMGDSELLLEQFVVQEQIEFLPGVPKKGQSDTAWTVQDQVALLAAMLKKEQSILERACAQQIAPSMFRPPPGSELEPSLAVDFGRTSIVRLSL
eukprot:TRINITY_DN4784_c0_g1_i3.p1 TRINITY_DN4784_c0_g1~~TRINITY_DN4784_c0_g1_i3.p1  ORF type:complete len:220 (+),score=45.04 TRINITY_DN4784_c0_g1_i3:77-736(+)